MPHVGEATTPDRSLPFVQLFPPYCSSRLHTTEHDLAIVQRWGVRIAHTNASLRQECKI
jgi:hypothetical protein